MRIKRKLYLHGIFESRYTFLIDIIIPYIYDDDGMLEFFCNNCGWCQQWSFLNFIKERTGMMSQQKIRIIYNNVNYGDIDCNMMLLSYTKSKLPRTSGQLI